MVKIPKNLHKTSAKLDNTPFETPTEIVIPRDDFERDYSGMSSIGNPCLRALQYSARRATKSEDIEPRINRIFDMGHILEAYMVKQLQNIGIEVTGQQDEIIGFAGHWKGHIDGRCINVPEAPKTEHLLECKTHNLKSFNNLVKNKVQQSHPKHYYQMMRYMHGLKLTRGLYVAFCKDNCHYHIERIYYSEREASDLVRKEQEVLLSTKLFPRIGNGKPSWYDCKFCNHHSVCYGRQKSKQHCRTCARVDMENGGIWRCGMDKTQLTYKQQMVGCKMYELDEMFK